MFTQETSAPTTVSLRTRRDFTLCTQALESRADDLEKLAKKNIEGGYAREGRTQLADVAAIKEFILPRFRDQQELPLVTEEELKAGIANGIRDLVSGALIVRAPEDKQEDALRSREDHLVERLSNRIANYAMSLAERSFAAGYAAREDDAEVLAHKALGALGG